MIYKRNAKECWVDLYDKPHLQGSLKRHFGPVELAGVHLAGAKAASAIVGPGARVEVVGIRGAKQVVRKIASKVVIKDVKTWARGMKIRSIRILTHSDEVK